MEFLKNKIWKAIEFHKNNGLDKMSKSQIKLLPKNYVKTINAWELEKNWHLLPNHFRNDFELSQYKFCTNHNQTTGDVIDGPPNRKINCPYCKNVK